MKKVWTAAGLALSLVVASACGKSAVEKQAEEAARQLEEAAKKMEAAAKDVEKDAGQGAASMAEGLEAMARGFGALAGQGGEEAVEPVSFKELQTAFGVLPGWEMAKPTGEKMTAPVPFSKASVIYRKGDARIEATLIDSGFNQLVVLPYAWITNMGYEKETESGYEKATQVAGFPGFEKWDSERRDGEVNAFVNKRYILQLEGSNLDDPKVLHDLAQATQLSKLPAK
ncbi:MAG TPA: hypothetical protein VIL35_12260 [Vicinamibacterales bacterium]